MLPVFSQGFPWDSIISSPEIPLGIYFNIFSGIPSRIILEIAQGIRSGLFLDFLPESLQGFLPGFLLVLLTGFLQDFLSRKSFTNFFGIPSEIPSQFSSEIPSGILSGIFSEIYLEILPEFPLGINPGIPLEICSQILSGVPYDIYSVILSSMFFGISPGIYPGLLHFFPWNLLNDSWRFLLTFLRIFFSEIPPGYSKRLHLKFLQKLLEGSLRDS